MVEINNDVKTMGIPINMQRVFNPLVEAATLRLPDSQIGNFNVAIEDLNVSVVNCSVTIADILKDNFRIFRRSSFLDWRKMLHFEFFFFDFIKKINN